MMSRQLALILLALLFVLAACQKEAEDTGAAQEKSEGEGQAEGEDPGEEAESPEENTSFDPLASLEEAGFQADPSVPFDDGGAIPIDFSSGAAEKQTAADAWVLKHGDAWVQVASGTFEDAAAAAAFAEKHDGSFTRENVVLFVLPLGDESPVDQVREALAP